MFVTYNMLTPPRNLTQVTSHDHYAHIYVSLLGYLVPHHHLLIELTVHLLYVHLRLYLRVLLCGRERRKSVLKCGFIFPA